MIRATAARAGVQLLDVDTHSQANGACERDVLSTLLLDDDLHLSPLGQEFYFELAAPTLRAEIAIVLDADPPSIVMRVAFLGCKPVAEACFELVLATPTLEVAAVATNVDAGAAWWGSAAITDMATRAGIPVLDNAERQTDELLEIVRSRSVDVLLSVQHPWILPPVVLDSVRGRAFNVHNAPLPDLKGFNSANHAILLGLSEFAATVHWMTDEPDAAIVAFEDRFPIRPDETAVSLHGRAAKAAVAAFGRLIDCLATGTPVPREERPGEGTFFARSSLDDARAIPDPSDLDDVDRRARALYFPPFEPAHMTIAGRRHHVVPSWSMPEE
jgi:methionyl-tRNA formyltransferase